jgi:hypothetical protein
MATWTNIKLTTEGQIMHARALSNQTKLQVLRVVGATGTVSGSTAKDLSGRKIEADLISVAQDDTNCVVKFQFSNNELLEDIIIKEIGFFVRDDFGKTVLFSYMTDSNPETLPRGNAGEDEVVFEYLSAFGYADSANVILRPNINNGVNEETVRNIVTTALNNDTRINNQNFLPLSGGTVTGDTTFRSNVTANSLKVINRDKEATVNITEDNRLQVGGSRLDSVVINSSNVPKWSNGTRAVDLATKEDLNGLSPSLDNRYLKKDGDSIEGNISIKEGNKLTLKNATPGIQLNINGDENNRAFIRQGRNAQRGTSLDVGGAKINNVSLISKERPVWYRPSNAEQAWLPESSQNGSILKNEPLALLSDINELKTKITNLNSQLQNKYRNRPYMVSLVDWDRMIREGGGDRESILSVKVVAANDVHAHGGDNGTLRSKYRDSQAVIFLKEDYMNYDEIVFITCSDSGWHTAYYSMETWLFDYAMSEPMSFDITGGASFHWQLMPKVTLTDYPLRSSSTNTTLVCFSQNSAVIDILGIRYNQPQ